MSIDPAQMSDFRDLPVDQRRLLSAVARRFYLDGVSKLDIAAELGLSRFKVARLIDQARASGLVTITLNDSGYVLDDLSARLCEHLRLREAVVVESHGDDAAVRLQVGGAAARLLTATLHDGDVLGLAWGRTITAMTQQLADEPAGAARLPRVPVVQLTGAVGADLRESPVELVRRVSTLAGGQAHPIFAPLLVEDAATASVLRRQPDVAAALQLFERVTTAVLAVGSWDPPISQLREVMSPEDREGLAGRGVVAEVAGILLDDDGRLAGQDVAERSLSITAAQLSRVPRVMAVAAGADKARAVMAVARSGLVSSLVVDRAMAEPLLEMPWRGAPGA